MRRKVLNFVRIGVRKLTQRGKKWNTNTKNGTHTYRIQKKNTHTHHVKLKLNSLFRFRNKHYSWPTGRTVVDLKVLVGGRGWWLRQLSTGSRGDNRQGGALPLSLNAKFPLDYRPGGRGQKALNTHACTCIHTHSHKPNSRQEAKKVLEMPEHFTVCPALSAFTVQFKLLTAFSQLSPPYI